VSGAVIPLKNDREGHVHEHAHGHGHEEYSADDGPTERTD
jgi:hypothetical protein